MMLPQTTDTSSRYAHTGSLRFAYAITPSTAYVSTDDDHPSYASIALEVVNTGDADVACDSILVAIPIGDDAGSLTDSASFIVTPQQPDIWNAQNNGDGTVILVPVTPNTGVKAGESITFQFSGIAVNSAIGGAAITLTESTDQARNATIIVSKVQSSLRIVSLTAAPVLVKPGAKTIVSWATTGATHCTMMQAVIGNDPGSGARLHSVTDNLAANGQITDAPTTTIAYTLIAHGDGPDATGQVIVAVLDPAVTSFTSSALEVDPGDDVTLTWTTADADYCLLGPDGTKQPANDSVVVTPDRTTTYSLTPYAGTTSAPPVLLTITVRSVAIESFTVGPSSVSPGREKLLTWKVVRSLQCSIDNGVGLVKSADSVAVQPQITTTYTLTGTGRDGSTTASLDVKPAGWYQAQSGAPFPLFGPLIIDDGKRLLVLSSPDSSWKSPMTAHQYTRADGWTTLPAPANNFLRITPGGAFFKGKYWSLGGTPTHGPIQFSGDVASSTDGINWTVEVDRAPWGPRLAAGVVVFQDALWIMAGAGSTTIPGDVWKSTDGVNWTCVTAKAPWRPRAYPTVGLFGDGMILAGGGANFTDIWTSTDGKNWTQLPVPAGGLVEMFRTGVVKGVLLIVARATWQNPISQSWVCAPGQPWSAPVSDVPWFRGSDSMTMFDGEIWMLGGNGDTWHYTL